MCPVGHSHIPHHSIHPVFGRCSYVSHLEPFIYIHGQNPYDLSKATLGRPSCIRSSAYKCRHYSLYTVQLSDTIKPPVLKMRLLSATFNRAIGSLYAEQLLSCLSSTQHQLLRRIQADRYPVSTYPCYEAVHADFISIDHDYLSRFTEITPAALGGWFLYPHVDTRGHAIISREASRVAGEWRATEELGYLLEGVEDPSSRKTPAVTAFCSGPCGTTDGEDNALAKH